jgi:hypothetical protein
MTQDPSEPELHFPGKAGQQVTGGQPAKSAADRYRRPSLQTTIHAVAYAVAAYVILPSRRAKRRRRRGSRCMRRQKNAPQLRATEMKTCSFGDDAIEIVLRQIELEEILDFAAAVGALWRRSERATDFQ